MSATRLGAGNKEKDSDIRTFGKSRAQETRHLLNHGIRSNEGVIFASQFLDQLLISVELLQVVRRHGIDTMMLGAVDVMLIAKNAMEFLSQRNS
jgi:hypothetical protein